MKNGLFGSELQSFKTFAKRLQNHVVLCKKGLKNVILKKRTSFWKVVEMLIQKRQGGLFSGWTWKCQKLRNESTSGTLLGFDYAENGSEKQFRIDKIFNGRFWLICQTYSKAKMVKNGQFCGGSCNNLKIGRPGWRETLYLSRVDLFKFVHERAWKKANNKENPNFEIWRNSYFLQFCQDHKWGNSVKNS